MTTSLVVCLMFLGQTEREPHPLAPSIPQLTKHEEAKIQIVIDRFIKYDIGKLGGAEGKKALEDFHRLGPEAIFLLIDSFNGAANLEHSCPVVIIGKKISTILNGSKDLELLTFAKENIGVGVTSKRHLGSVRDLQDGVLFRRAAVQRQAAFAAAAGTFTGKVPAAMSPAELARAAQQEKGPRLQGVLVEASKRPGTLALDIFAVTAARPEKDVKEMGRLLLVQNLNQQKDADVRKLFKHEKPEVRAAAAVSAMQRGWGEELIDLLEDSAPLVQKTAHQGLVNLNRGQDVGPSNLSSPGDRATAVARWRAWWAERMKAQK